MASPEHPQLPDTGGTLTRGQLDLAYLVVHQERAHAGHRRRDARVPDQHVQGPGIRRVDPGVGAGCVDARPAGGVERSRHLRVVRDHHDVCSDTHVEPVGQCERFDLARLTARGRQHAEDQQPHGGTHQNEGTRHVGRAGAKNLGETTKEVPSAARVHVGAAGLTAPSPRPRASPRTTPEPPRARRGTGATSSWCSGASDATDEGWSPQPELRPRGSRRRPTSGSSCTTSTGARTR